MTITDISPDTTDCGCPDFTMSRRRLLATAAAGAGTLAAGTMFGDAFRQVAYGATGGNTVVVMSMRGGWDGLSVVPPTNDADQQILSSVRPDLVIPTASVAFGANGFGFHPALAALKPMWDAGTLGAVHGVALPNPNRSHFDAIIDMEDADPGSVERRGWINRMIGAKDLPEYHIHLGGSMIPLQLAGSSPSLAVGSVNELTLPGLGDEKKLGKAMMKAWRGKGPMNGSVRRAVESTQRLKKLSKTDIGALAESYPDGPLRYVLSNTAAMIKANVGARVITIDYGNWDTHESQGVTNDVNGLMHTQLDHFGTSVAQFFKDLGPKADKVTLVTISEFGRRVAQNGQGGGAGTDHGYGQAMLMMGGGVNGGTVNGVWQGLSALEEGDVRKYNDYRNILWEVMSARLPEASGKRSTMFPGLSYKPTGTMK
jgi:uncharacterized protein (DUF1501 family)